MKKFLLLSLAVIVLLCPSTVSAFTAQQFANKGKVWMSTGCTMNVSGGNNFVTFEKGDITLETVNIDGVTCLKVTDFVDTDRMPEAADAYFYLQINGNNATVPANTQKLCIQWGIGSNDYLPICSDINVIKILNKGGYWYFLARANGNAGVTGSFNNTLQFSCSTVDGEYQIDLGNYYILKCPTTMASGTYHLGGPNGTKYTSSYYSLSSSLSSGNLTLQTYTPNATVTDTKYTYNGTTKSGKSARSYTATVNFTDDSFTITNWNNTGLPYIVNVSSYNSTLQKFDGTFNNNDLTVSLNGRDIMGYLSSSNYKYSVKMGKTFSTSNGSVTDIPGKVSGTVAHQGPHTWLEASNAKTVLNNVSINFDDYVIAGYNSSSNPKYVYRNYVETPVIKLNDALEYTHNLSLSKIYGYNAETGDIYLNVDLTDFKNSAYVKEYQLYIVPGKFTMPNYSDADFSDKDNGHVKGVRIDEFTSDYVPAELSGARNVAATGDKVNFNLLFKESALKESANKGEYSIYVKAIYTEDSKLAPSFHALTPLNDVTTGVTTLVVDTDAPTVFFNMNGVQVDGDNMAPGVYIKKQGNKTSKVVIR